jgi:hypothetical protein
MPSPMTTDVTMAGVESKWRKVYNTIPETDTNSVVTTRSEGGSKIEFKLRTCSTFNLQT